MKIKAAVLLLLECEKKALLKWTQIMHEKSYQYLIEQLAPHIGDEEIVQIDLAYRVAMEAHRGQMRDEGTPYIIHPLRVAISLVDELQIHSPMLISSALLHDVIEDSPATREDIERDFGPQVAEVVWLLTKFEDTSLEDYLAAIEAASHTGAAIVKLCDRLDNLRHVFHSPKMEKKRRYLYTTERLYLPLAERTNGYLHRELSRLLRDLHLHLESLA
ncbi:MAG: HD domain-containing protein [Acidobacteriota bacterium]